MGEVLNFPLPEDPARLGKLLMKLARQENKDLVRRAELFKKAKEVFDNAKTLEASNDN